MSDYAAGFVVGKVAVFLGTKSHLDFIRFVHFVTELRGFPIDEYFACSNQSIRFAAGAVVLVREIFVDAHREGGFHDESLSYLP